MITGPNINRNGLIMYLDAANPKSYISGGTEWNDLSIYKNNGTLTSGTTFSSDNKGVIGFDGIGDYCSLGAAASSLVQGKSDMSMGILFKLDALDTLRGLIGTLNYSCGSNLGLVANGTSLRFYNDYDTICYNIGLSSYLEVDKWIYAVGTYDGITTRMYGIKDDVLSQNSGTIKSGYTNNFVSDFRVMGNEYALNFTTGQTAMSFVYNKALTEEEILENYNAIKLRFGL